MSANARSRSYSHARLLGASLLFAAGLCTAILVGCFSLREGGRQPGLGAQIRAMHGVSSTELAEQERAASSNPMDATLLANEAAAANIAQQNAHTHSVLSQPVVSTAHHQVRRSL